ncbi:MAG: hypothetical protein CVT70_07120 [Alphaproteobacteria bacterium HGW-Alphaproteobacteria-1]|jgi:EPS-associated MarR family transcriptional regulator|nr:MAG: hypothetical protein CVT70_07120 [Alphaproteobacteria bacterium HGW-Alphaproteobacteria-1]
MTTRRNQLRQDGHCRILSLLHDNPEMSQRDLARAVGVSNGGIHHVLSVLLDKGLIKLGSFTVSEGGRRCANVLTRKGIADKAAQFLARKMAEYEATRAEVERLLDGLATTMLPISVRGLKNDASGMTPLQPHRVRKAAFPVTGLDAFAGGRR